MYKFTNEETNVTVDNRSTENGRFTLDVVVAEPDCDAILKRIEDEGYIAGVLEYTDEDEAIIRMKGLLGTPKGILDRVGNIILGMCFGE